MKYDFIKVAGIFILVGLIAVDFTLLPIFLLHEAVNYLIDDCELSWTILELITGVFSIIYPIYFYKFRINETWSKNQFNFAYTCFNLLECCFLATALQFICTEANLLCSNYTRDYVTIGYAPYLSLLVILLIGICFANLPKTNSDKN